MDSASDYECYLKMIKGAGYKYVITSGNSGGRHGNKFCRYIALEDDDYKSQITSAMFDGKDGKLLSIYWATECKSLELFDDWGIDDNDSGLGD